MVLRKFLAVSLIDLAFIVSRAGAQFSNVTCLPGYQWAFNSKNQSPCVIAAYLGSQCDANGWSVNTLQPGYIYGGPPVSPGDACQCSTVVYSLTSACGACQNITWERWSTWSQNCSNDITMGNFPKTIPYGTSVPHYGYQDISLSDLFNVTQARLDAATNPPESTGVASSTTVNPSSSAPSVGFSTTGTSSVGPSTTPASSSSHSSNAGAIAGGVVGGLVGLGLIAGLIAFFLIRSRRAQSHVPASAGYGSATTPGYYSAPASAFPVSPPPPMSQQKLYDPSDPSTFPSQPSPPSGTTFQTSYQGSNNQYHGVAEL